MRGPFVSPGRLLGALLAVAGCRTPGPGPAAGAAPTGPAPSVDPGPVGIDFDGRLPGASPEFDCDLDLVFRIYAGADREPSWEERRRVPVRRGRIRLVLGEAVPVPLALLGSPSKLLAMAPAGGRELFLRLPIVQVAYASASEALSARAEGRTLGDGPGPEVAGEERGPATWLEALADARAGGGDLPGALDWYRALLECPPADVPLRAGRFEWVRPWVLDPGSQGDLGRFFRGRPAGGRPEELAPDRMYHYRVMRGREGGRGTS